MSKKRVIICEKPSASRNFAKALGGMNGIYDGVPYQIVALRGHLLEFREPHENVKESLADQFKSWNPDYIPWDLSALQFKLTLKKGTQSIIKNVRGALGQNAVAVIATDDDPTGEGQRIARNVLDYINWQGEVERMYFEDEEESSIQKAFKNRQSLPTRSEEDLEHQKALARSKWDYGSMQIVRLMTKYAQEEGFNGVVLYNGRLKSVMIKLVGSQEEKRANYVRKPYYEVAYKDGKTTYSRKVSKDDEPDFRFDNKEDVDVDRYVKVGTPEEVSRRKRSKAPAKLLDLEGLTAILAPKGYKPKEILETYQKMYDDGVVSYPRTEDKYITEDQFNTLKKQVYKIADVVGVDRHLITHLSPRKTHIKKGMAHGANRPGKNVPSSLDGLSKYGKSAKEIYKTLAYNSLAMFAEDYEYESISLRIKEHPEFVASKSIPLSLGYKAIFDESVLEDKDDSSEDSEDEQIGQTAERFIKEGSNKKPPVPSMKWLSKQLEKYNVGTGATRTGTVADLSGGKHAALNEKKGILSLTETGQLSYHLLRNAYIGDPKVTEKLLSQMNSVGKGDITADSVLRSLTAIVEHDKREFIRNKQKLVEKCGGFKVYNKDKAKDVERVSGTWNGEDVTFKREWGVSSGSPYRFTDDDVETLLDGGEITFEKKTAKGNMVDFIGKLAKQEYKGHEYVGLKAMPKFLYDKQGWDD